MCTKNILCFRLNRTSGLGTNKLHTTLSTPDMNRTHSMVKSMIKPGRTSPQHTPSFGRTMLSFIKRATPQKTLTKEVNFQFITVLITLSFIQYCTLKSRLEFPVLME